MKRSDSDLLNISKHRFKSFSPAFTIVELLVVIVVIGILAAITIVAYVGVSQKAMVASLQSDLDNSSKQLKMFQTIYGSYPTTISIDCTATPDTATNKCLKLSSGNTITSLTGDYSVNNTTSPQTFRLTITNTSSNTISVVTDSAKPIVLLPAPLSPVADWQAIPTGDHYGNFYDAVSKSYATVTRTTPKTIYDPATQHIYDVPAGKLAVNPRSDGASGSEAVVEEARTNYLVNSSLELDSNADGNADGWTYTGNTIVGTPRFSLINSTLQGDSAQRIQYTGLPGDSGDNIGVVQSISTGFLAADSAYGYVYIKNDSVGISNVQIRLYAYLSLIHI